MLSHLSAAWRIWDLTQGLTPNGANVRRIWDVLCPDERGFGVWRSRNCNLAEAEAIAPKKGLQNTAQGFNPYNYSLRLPELCCDFFELTDFHGAESLRRLPVEPGDLVLVDRGYNDRRAVGQILDCGGELIMRYNSGAFPLLNPAGQPFDPLPKLRPLKIGQTGEWKVRFVVENGRQLSARLCALRKSPEQARRARVRAQRKSKRNNSQVRPETLEYADYVVLLSTLSSQEMKLAAVLEFWFQPWEPSK